MGRRAFTLVELIITIAIMATLMAIATLNWNAMQVKSAIENQIKIIHADLQQVRLQALYSKTPRSVIILNKEYKEFATTDTSAAPVETKQLKYPVVWDTNASGLLTFNASGVTIYEGSLCIPPPPATTITASTDANSVAVDSIVVSPARLNLGWRRGGSCTSDNIDQK